MAPTFTWGSRIGGGTPNLTPPSLSYNTGGFLDMVRTNDVAISVTRLMGRHTVKAGYQLDHSLKNQEQLGNPKAFQGTVNFGNDTNNPIDSGFGYANAALGIFSSYSQSNHLLEGHFIYDSHEWYVQDNWKVNEPAVARLRPAHHPSGRELRHAAAGFELLRQQVVRGCCPATLCARVLGEHEPVSGGKPDRRGPEDRRIARHEHGRGHRHHRAEQRQPVQRHHQGGRRIENGATPGGPRFGHASARQ